MLWLFDTLLPSSRAFSRSWQRWGCLSIASLLVLGGQAAGFNPQPEPPASWYVEGYIDMWAQAIDPTGAEMPFGIDPYIVGDAMLDFSAGVIARFDAPTAAAADKPVDGLYDADFEYFGLQIGDTTWDQTMPSAIQFQVVGGVVNGSTGIYTDTLPAHPDLSFALPASPGSWVAQDKRDDVDLGVITGTYSLRDGEVLPDPCLIGDTNLSGYVDDDDLSLILSVWNQSFRGDLCWLPSGEYVDDDELILLLAHWNEGTPPLDGSAVPEPATLVLLAFGGLALIRRRG